MSDPNKDPELNRTHDRARDEELRQLGLTVYDLSVMQHALVSVLGAARAALVVTPGQVALVQRIDMVLAAASHRRAGPDDLHSNLSLPPTPNPIHNPIPADIGNADVLQLRAEVDHLRGTLNVAAVTLRVVRAFVLARTDSSVTVREIDNVLAVIGPALARRDGPEDRPGQPNR